MLEARTGGGAVPGGGEGGCGVRGTVETLSLLSGAQEDQRQADGELTEAGRSYRQI